MQRAYPGSCGSTPGAGGFLTCVSVAERRDERGAPGSAIHGVNETGPSPASRSRTTGFGQRGRGGDGTAANRRVDRRSMWPTASRTASVSPPASAQAMHVARSRFAVSDSPSPEATPSPFIRKSAPNRVSLSPLADNPRPRKRGPSPCLRLSDAIGLALLASTDTARGRP